MKVVKIIEDNTTTKPLNKNKKMKKLLILTLIITSCKAQDYIQKPKFTVLEWKHKSETFDIYQKDSLVVKQVPCAESNKIYLHGYPNGNYTFVFRNKEGIVEEKTIKITNK